MKKDISHFLHTSLKWTNILNTTVFTSQNFLTLRRKGLNYNLQEYFKEYFIRILSCLRTDMFKHTEKYICKSLSF